jgi:hypothetical protein
MRRGERNERITKAVSELIGGGSAWVYAVCAQEQNLFRDVVTHVTGDRLMETLRSSKDVVYSAQLEFAGALAQT